MIFENRSPHRHFGEKKPNYKISILSSDSRYFALALKNSYFCRIVDECNSLPPEVRLACNVDKFKANNIKFVTKLQILFQF